MEERGLGEWDSMTRRGWYVSDPRTNALTSIWGRCRNMTDLRSDFSPWKGSWARPQAEVVSRAAAFPRTAIWSELPTSLYSIQILQIFILYYKMQFVRLKSLTNNKNMYRNQIWFNLKIKDAWKTSIVPDILTKCPWKLLYTERRNMF